MKFGSRTILIALATLFACCASTPQSARLARQQPASLSQSAMIDSLPFFAQDRYQCGPAALAMLMNHQGITVSPQSLVDDVYVPALEGSLQPEMKASLRARHLLPYQLAPKLVDLLTEVEAGNPVLVMQNLGLQSLPQWHYAVVKGFDLQAGELILNSGEIENYRVSLRTFERTWQRAEHWAIVAIQPGDIPATANSQAYFSTLSEYGETGSDYLELETAYNAGLAIWPQDRNLLMGLGNLHLARKDYERARQIFTRLLDWYPDYGPAHNNLAVSFLHLDQPDQASRHVRQALASDDNFMDTYLQTRSQILEIQQ